jgi:pimeloyl-ACP methyl ester carboxylesterase
MYVLAIDLPGHGLSSHIPSGVPYTDLTWISEIKRVVDYLKWTKFSIIAHSMGANASLHFALLFHDLVERVITLDTVKPAVYPIDELADRTKQDIQNFLTLEERAKRIKHPDPVFSYDTAMQALKVAHSPIGN